jgi:sodium-dependent dicarboxylate transporter 2/3/5
VLAVTACIWIARPWLQQVTGASGWQPLAGLSDAGIAMTAAVALCVLPADRSRRVMDWATAERLPWGILILFGGGLSLAAAVQANGVAEFLSAHAMALGGLPPIALVLAVTTGVILLTELTSNTATTATLVPILAAFAPGLGVHPDYLILPATIAASCAFMLPVATPPNALVFGSGYVTIPEMARAGIWMNLIGIVLITVVMYAVIIPLFRLA